MLGKFIFIYLTYLLLTEGIYGQIIGAGINTEEVIMNNNTTANSLGANIAGSNMISASPTQANDNIDPMGLTNIIANSPANLEPIAASLANPGDTDDLMRSARGALIGGYGNPGISTVGLVGSPVPPGPYTGGIPGMVDGVMLGAGIGGDVDAFGSVTQPIREFITDRPIPEVMRVSMSPGPVVGFPPGAISGGLANGPVAINALTLPGATVPITDKAINAMNIGHSIANGPLSTPILGEFSQVSVPNRLLNPIAFGAIPNLQNSVMTTGIPTDVKVSTFASPVFTNGPSLQGMVTKSLPATFPGNDLAASKQILASLTGIDPASLGAKTKFKVTSASPIAPTGLKIQADNLLMEGKLTVSGNLPFLGSVTVDGVLPDGGKGTVMYESGNGNIGIVNKGFAPPGIGLLAADLNLNPSAPNGWAIVANNGLGLRNNVF